jgi:SNF2 family DNA or RNA helicase
MDPHFNEALDEQAAQRIDRHGQKHVVVVRKLYMRGSVDEAIRTMQEKKRIQVAAWTQGENKRTLDAIGLFLQQNDTV